MRPLRCSMRPGFQGTSKWNRSAQWVWRLTPSRAASVAIRMRSGCFAGSALKRALDLLAALAAREAVDSSMRSSARSVRLDRRSRMLLR